VNLGLLITVFMMEEQIMKNVILGSRYLLGLIFFVFGLNGFLNFLPMPPLSPEAGAFMGGLAGSGYFFPLLKSFETLSGLLLLSNRYVPLALMILSPISVNIFMFHAFLDPAGLGLSILIGLLMITLGYGYRKSFEKALTAKTGI